MEVKELRQQLKRVHSKDPKQEEYVRKKKQLIVSQSQAFSISYF